MSRRSAKSVKARSAAQTRTAELEKVERAQRARKSKPPQERYIVDDIVAALRSAAGIKSAAAKALGIAASTLSGYFSRHPELHDAQAEIEEGLLDLAEGKLLLHVQKGNLDALKFYLSTKGKNRGYSKRIESTGKDGKPIELASKAPAVRAELQRRLERLAAAG